MFLWLYSVSDIGGDDQGCLREVNAWYSSHEPRIFTSSSELDPFNKTRVRRFSSEGVS